MKDTSTEDKERAKALQLADQWEQRSETVEEISHGRDSYFNAYADATERCADELKEFIEECLQVGEGQ